MLLQADQCGIQSQAIFLLESLIAKGTGIPEAISFATKLVQDEDKRYRGLRIFQSLIRKKHGMKEALSAAQQLLTQESTYLKNFVLRLIEELIDNDF